MRRAWPVLLGVFLACSEGRVVPEPVVSSGRDAASTAHDAGPDPARDAEAGDSGAVMEDASGIDAAALDAASPIDASPEARDATPAGDAAPDAAAPDAAIAADGGVVPAVGCGAGVTQRAVGLRSGMGFSTQIDANAVIPHPSGAMTIVGTLSGRETFGAGTPQQITLQGSQIGSPLVVHFDAAGAFAWGKVFSTSSGSGSGGGRASDGSVVVTGSFEETLVVDAGLPSEQRLTGPGSAEGYDLFVARIDATGGLMWIRTAGGEPFDFPGAIAVAPDGASVIAGRYGDFSRPNTITFDATHALTSQGRWEELFLVAYDPQGAVRWVRQAGSPGRDDFAHGMTMLADGSVVLTGTLDTGDAVFQGGSRPDGALTIAGSAGYYLARYTSAGDLEWLEGATGETSGSGVASYGGTVVVAVTGGAGATFDPGTPSARSLATAARAVAHYAADGTLSSLTPIMDNISIGGPDAIAAAPDGTLALTGSYYSRATFYTASGDVTLMPAGWDDAFVACLAPGATALSWIRQGRGTLQEYGRDVAFDGLGRIVGVGTTRDGMSFEVGNGMSLPIAAGQNGYAVVIGR